VTNLIDFFCKSLTK